MGSQDGAEDSSGGGSGYEAEAPQGGRWGAAPASDALKAWRAATREVGSTVFLYCCMSSSTPANLITHATWQTTSQPVSSEPKEINALALSNRHMGQEAAPPLQHATTAVL